jgi:hypothetical protein
MIFSWQANGGQTRKAHMADAADMRKRDRDFGLPGEMLDHAAVQIPDPDSTGRSRRVT